MRAFELFACCLVVAVHATERPCEPDIPGCVCDAGSLRCAGPDCTQLPPTVPTNFTEFIFDNCDINSISQVPYPKAKTFLLSGASALTISAGAFSQLTDLKSLTLSNNGLREINKDMFQGLDNLNTLWLQGNDLTTLTKGTFDNTPKLEILDLASNENLQLEEGSLDGLSNLNTLQLDKCGLKEVPSKTIAGLGNLKKLILNHNKLDKLESDVFDDLKELEELNLVDCSLSFIDENAFDGLKKLKFLDLGYNNLSMLEENALDDSKEGLKTFSVQHNNFKALPHDLLKWNELVSVQLAGNPWTCDCPNHWMQVLHANLLGNLTCAGPAEVAGQDLHNVTMGLDCSGYYNDKSTIVMAIVIPLIIICVLLIAYYVYKIFENKKKRGNKKSVRYSSVYKDTVEALGPKKDRPMSEL